MREVLLVLANALTAEPLAFDREGIAPPAGRKSESDNRRRLS